MAVVGEAIKALEQVQGEPASGVRAREGEAVEWVEQIFTKCLLALGSA